MWKSESREGKIKFFHRKLRSRENRVWKFIEYTSTEIILNEVYLFEKNALNKRNFILHYFHTYFFIRRIFSCRLFFSVTFGIGWIQIRFSRKPRLWWKNFILSFRPVFSRRIASCSIVPSSYETPCIFKRILICCNLLKVKIYNIYKYTNIYIKYIQYTNIHKNISTFSASRRTFLESWKLENKFRTVL